MEEMLNVTVADIEEAAQSAISKSKDLYCENCRSHLDTDEYVEIVVSVLVSHVKNASLRNSSYSKKTLSR